jgi:hypothetical protein
MMKTLALAMVMAVLVTSVVLADDTGPTGVGDHNGRSGASAAASTRGDHPTAGPQGGHVTPDRAKPGISGGQN